MSHIDRKPYDLGGQAIHQNVQGTQYCVPEGLLFSDRQVWERVALAMGRRQEMRPVRPNKTEKQTLRWSIFSSCGVKCSY
jgi:hypothetical protein